jgi:hypothetical protein
MPISRRSEGRQKYGRALDLAEGPETPRPGLTSRNALSGAHPPWPCPSLPSRPATISSSSPGDTSNGSSPSTSTTTTRLGHTWPTGRPADPSPRNGDRQRDRHPPRRSGRHHPRVRALPDRMSLRTTSPAPCHLCNRVLHSRAPSRLSGSRRASHPLALGAWPTLLQTSPRNGGRRVFGPFKLVFPPIPPTRKQLRGPQPP